MNVLLTEQREDAFAALWGSRRGGGRYASVARNCELYGPRGAEAAEFVASARGAAHRFKAFERDLLIPSHVVIDGVLCALGHQRREAARLCAQHAAAESGLDRQETLALPFPEARTETLPVAFIRYAALAVCCYELMADADARSLYQPWRTVVTQCWPACWPA